MKRIRSAKWACIVLVWVTVLLAPDRAWACPNCKEAVSLQSGEEASLASGYNWSVLFMLTVPFSMFGTGAFLVHRAVRRGTLPEF